MCTRFGKVQHDRATVKDEDGDIIQKDRFRVDIPTTVLSEEGRNLLHLWAVEEFDCACVDWATGEIHLCYHTAHYIPEDCVQDDIEEEF